MAQSALQQEELLTFIRKHPRSSLNTVLNQFASTSPWAVLALLAALQDKLLIKCTTVEGETCFIAEDKTWFSYLDAANAAFENSLTTVAKMSFKGVKIILGLQHKENKKKYARQTELENRLAQEACSYQCSLYEVELMLLQGLSLSDIANKTGYSESWLNLFAIQCKVQPKQAQSEPSLMTEVDIQEKLEDLLATSLA